MSKERINNMIDKLKDRVEECKPMSFVFLAQTYQFLQDSYNDKEIDSKTFNESMYRLRSIANSFPLNCSCVKKMK